MFYLTSSVVPFVLPGIASVAIAAGTMPFQTWASLCSYEDVHALIHSEAPRQYTAIGAQGGLDVAIVVSGWVVAMTAQAIGAILVTRSAVRGFDDAVGRPIRARDDGRRR